MLRNLAIVVAVTACIAADRPLDEAPLPAPPPATEHPLVTTIEGWGTVIDPDQDCTIQTRGNQVAFTVAATAHQYAAELHQWNAPRVLSGAGGDFVAEVKISGEFNPDSQGSTVKGRKAYNGGGLLVVADQDNHVSLQHGAFWQNGHIRHYLNFMMRKGGEVTVSQYGMDLEDKDTWLRLERRGSRFTASTSQDGSTWHSYEPAEIDLPTKLQLGVYAVNSNKQEFHCAFEDFTLLQHEALK